MRLIHSTCLLYTLALLTLGACGGQKKFSIPIASSSDESESRSCMLPGWIPCGDTCVNPQFDPDHCGACDTPCQSGELCVNGTCQADCGDLEQCGSTCRYADDPFNCGACGVSCDWGCAGDKCGHEGDNSSEGCADGHVGCDGLCVDADSDPENCGRCGNRCSSGLCQGGTCIDTCPGSMRICDGKCVDIMSSTYNCGGCGKYCVGECRDGCCDGELCNGKCVDTADDDYNCGGCGNECRYGYHCSVGECVCTSYDCF